MQTEYANYFDAIGKHPRLLVGQTVPAIGREGMETIRDANDAKDWQEAVKSILGEEVRSRAAAAMDANAGFLTTMHASVALFQENPDLIPGTKEFDTDLASRFTALAEPYELRVEGKLQGYSIPVQPIVAQLRAQLAAERAAKAASPGAAGSESPQAGATASTPAAPASPAAAAAAPTPTAAAAAPAVDPPQAGIPSKAGAGADDSGDFSVLFGTIGLPNIRI